MALLYQIYMKYFPIGLPPNNAFKDQAAVVTGATSGLGLAAAIHLLNLGASEVIISSRSKSRGEEAIQQIEKATGRKSKGKVRVVELDMSRYESVVAFASEIKKIRTGKGGVDSIILNAGMAGAEYRGSPEGWEQNIQTNFLSTTLLMLLLFPWLKTERANRPAPAHLAVVGSMQFKNAKINDWAKWQSEKGEGILEHLNKPKNFLGAQGMYASTKLLLLYAFRELAKRAVDGQGRPQIIMNIMCPGTVKTGLARDYDGKIMGLLVGIFFAIFAKTPENGARTYMAALTSKETEHGRFVQFYRSESQFKAFKQPNLDAPLGKKMQAQAWEEVIHELSLKVPETKAIVDM